MSADPTVEMLRAILEAFNRGDLDGAMAYFADDCVHEPPVGPEPFGARSVGKDAVRRSLELRFAAIPGAHFSDESHWIAGDRGVSEWTLTGAKPDGSTLRVRGCDHWQFRGNKVIRKDSYLKIVEP